MSAKAKKSLFLAVLFSFVPAVLAVDLQPATDVDAVLEAVAGYELDQSRAGLSAVEKMVNNSAGEPVLREQLTAKMVAMLGSEASIECKKFLCKQLSLIGSVNEAPALAALLGDKDLSLAARSALARIPGDQVLSALREASKKLTGKQLIGVINTLGDRRDESAVDIISKYMTDKDADVVSAAIDALGKIGNVAAGAALSDAKTTLPEKMQPLLRSPLLRYAEQLTAAGKNKEAEAIYWPLCAPKEPKNVRVGAFRGMVSCRKDVAADMILRALDGKDHTMRSAAVSCIPAVKGKVNTRVLVRWLPTYLSAIQVQFITVLVELNASEVLEDIIVVSKKPDLDVRLAALAAIGRLGGASHVKILAERVAKAEDAELEVIRESLVRLRGVDVNAAMIGMLSDPEVDLSVKPELIRALADRYATEAVPELLKMAKFGNWQSLETYKALQTLATEKDLPDLVELLMPPGKDAMRNQKEMAVVAAAQKITDENDRTAIVRAKLSSAPNVDATCSLLLVLGKLGGEKALDAVRNALDSDDEQIRIFAVRVLADWPDGKPLTDLLKVARQAKDSRSKILALHGVASLSSKAKDQSPEKVVEIIAEALPLADRPEEKKALLGAIGQFHNPAAIQVALWSLEDSALADEAGQAIVRIAEATWQAHPKEVGQALEKVLAVVKNATVCQKADEILGKIDKTIKVVVITGGHGFEQESFLKMFAGFKYVHANQQDHSEIFEDISGWDYDVIVLYNMTQDISPKRQKNFISLLDKGIGVVAMHHSIGAFGSWPEFQKIIGGKYYLEAVEENGVQQQASTYKDDVDIAVHVADNNHAVTRGVSDFAVRDETYKKCVFEPDNHILLSTDEPTSDKALCWVRKYGNANVCYIMQGHGTSIYANENYLKILTQAIRWSVGQ